VELSSFTRQTLIRTVQESLPGYYGARLTGAGFGGCTVNLVEKSATESFSAQLASRYLTRIGLKSEIYISHASDGAKMIW
jgi:galactokinase